MIWAVLDTNILVSAAIKEGGKPYQIVALASEKFGWLTSEFILAEVSNVIARPHIRKKYSDRMTPERRQQFLAAVRAAARMIEVKTELSVVADAGDNPILACAVDGKADYLVTGDPHLLRLRTYNAIQIVTADEFLRILAS